MTSESKAKELSPRRLFGIARTSGMILASILICRTLGAQGYVLLQVQDPGFVAGQPYSGFGGSPANAGDIDGDGVFDILVGAPNASPGGVVQAGSIYLFSGFTGTILRILAGASAYDHLGYPVRMGDLDGDGIGEHLLGALPGGPPTAGYVLIVSGASGSMVGTITGLAPGEGFPGVISGLDDVTGDGVPDIAVSAPSADPGGLIDAGEIRVFSGATGMQFMAIAGSSPDDHLGVTMATRVDHDGDGIVDIVAGAPVNASGRVDVYSGATGSLITTYLPGPGDVFGWAVDHGPDYDGDGQPDLVLGLPYNSPPLPPPCCLAGEVRVISGASGSALFSINGNHPNDAFGTWVRVLGDLDGDGFPEIAGWSAGFSGYSKILSGLTGGLLFTGYGAGEAAGDWNGDGVDEILVSVPWPPPGKVKVVSFVGIPPGSTTYGAGCPGGGGVVPAIVAAGDLPDVGPFMGVPTFQVGLLDALGGAPALLLLGVSNQSWSGVPLPLGLGSLGLPGCSLLSSVEAIVPVVASGTGPGNGKAFAPIPIPPDATLAGQTAYAQWYVVDPGPGLAPGAMSAGLALLIF